MTRALGFFHLELWMEMRALQIRRENPKFLDNQVKRINTLPGGGKGVEAWMHQVKVTDNYGEEGFRLN